MSGSAIGSRGRLLATVLIVVLLSHAVPFAPKPAEARSRIPVKIHPRARQVLVVTANVEEVWDAQDRSDPSDLRAFARRLDRVLPHPPDVLLLQEVSHGTSKRVAKLLRKRTGRRYGIAAPAGRNPAVVKKGRLFTRAAAILINRRTMKRIGRPRYVETTVARRHALSGYLPEVKRNPVALVRERRSGISYPVASLYLHARNLLRTKVLNRMYRKRWSMKIDRFVGKKWPRHRRRAIIGGDFNAKRDRWSNGRRVSLRWWRTMKARGYRDAVHVIKPFGGVDYIFTRGRIAASGVDWTYDQKAAAGTSSYYSDHRFRWALIGKWKPAAKARVMSSTGVELRWRPLPSVKRYEIQRRGPSSSGWRRVGRVTGHAIGTRDMRLDPVTRYRYRVVAWNGAEYSIPSRVMRVRTKPDKVPPRAPDAPHMRPLVKKKVTLKLRWPRTPDRGGSGGVTYEVWRQELGKDPRRIRITPRPWHVDRNLTKRVTVEYFVVAVDKVGNRSDRSAPATFIPPQGGPALTSG